MNVSHTIASIDSSNGGPSKSVTSLIESLGEQHTDSLYVLNCIGSANSIIEKFNHSNCKLNFYDSIKDQMQGLVKDSEKDKIDIYHGHGLWDLAIHNMAAYARKSGKPYIISIRGMLDVWSLNHKKWKKKIALGLYQRKDLRYAQVLHATSVTEAKNIRNAGFRNPIAIIPNGLEINPLKDTVQKNSGTKTALFLSRLVQNKGIEELLYAWDAQGDKTANWKLRIVGNGKEEYKVHIYQIANRLELKNIIFEGGIYGAEKDKIFAEADLFILPTYTENFGMAIAEALAAQIPVITTTGAPWSELNEAQAGWQIELNHENLVNAIQHALSENVNLKEMGKKGRILIEEKYSIDAVSKIMADLYAWISGSGEKPKFVIE